MLLNLSHHPNEGWPSEMKEASLRKYGKVVDFAFPQVDPFAAPHEINAQATGLVLQILSQKEALEGNLTVHIMGEMTLTYQVIRLLREEGVSCVASATERIVRMEPNGKRISIFKFRQFRQYW